MRRFLCVIILFHIFISSLIPPKNLFRYCLFNVLWMNTDAHRRWSDGFTRDLETNERDTKRWACYSDKSRAMSILRFCFDFFFIFLNRIIWWQFKIVAENRCFLFRLIHEGIKLTLSSIRSFMLGRLPAYWQHRTIY